MICSMTAPSIDTDKVFSALADKNRRKVVELLHKKEASIQELLPFFSVSFQGLSKHIKVLEEAQIVEKKRQGKFMICSLNRDALHTSLQWMERYSKLWNASFDTLEQLVDEEKKGDHEQ